MNKNFFNKYLGTKSQKIAFAITMFIITVYNWYEIKTYELTVTVPQQIDCREYGDWYVGGTNMGETRVHDAQGNYLGSVFNDPEMSATYYWWVPENSEMTFENALDFNEVNAAWTNEKFQDMFGSDFIVGCLPYHTECGGYEEWLKNN